MAIFGQLVQRGLDVGTLHDGIERLLGRVARGLVGDQLRLIRGERQQRQGRLELRADGRFGDEITQERLRGGAGREVTADLNPAGLNSPARCTT